MKLAIEIVAYLLKLALSSFCFAAALFADDLLFCAGWIFAGTLLVQSQFTWGMEE